MGLFKLFDINSKENAEVLPELTENTQGAENEETASPEEVKRDEKKIITITWGTGMPIDIIFPVQTTSIGVCDASMTSYRASPS